MKRNNESSVRCARKGQQGQMLLLAAASLVLLVGFAGLAFDTGKLYYSRTQLQASTDAAALAGAQKLPDTTATAAARTFSSVVGNKNAHANLPGVTMLPGYPQLTCRTTVPASGLPCVAPANANVIVVKQQVAVATTFMKLFGIGSVTITAKATASMRGAGRNPYNVAIIVDTTGSMEGSKLNNALAGVQILLKGLSPCLASLSACGSATPNGSGGGGNVTNPVDRVALYTFPQVTAATVTRDYNCSSSRARFAPYDFNSPPAVASTSLIVNFSSDYRASDTATTLKYGTDLVGAVDGRTSTSSPCLQVPSNIPSYVSGQTYFAQAIHLAGLDLATESRPNVQNVLIILSDGDSNADTSIMPGAPTTGSGAYPSTFYQCQQAIDEARLLKPTTRIYSVAYGASASSGCRTDPILTPCDTLQQMATDDSTFFKDRTSHCAAGARPTTDLNTIFTQIAGDLSVSRLIPD